MEERDVTLLGSRGVPGPLHPLWHPCSSHRLQQTGRSSRSRQLQDWFNAHALDSLHRSVSPFGLHDGFNAGVAVGVTHGLNTRPVLASPSWVFECRT